ncbi:MAG: phosphoribosyltransferase [Planctomycetota bacterium]
MEFRTIADMEATVRRMLPRVPRDVDVVVGIPRSGMIPASMFALYLNRPMTDLEGMLSGRLIRSGRRPVPGGDAAALANATRLLIVDDCVGNGTQLAAVQERLANENLKPQLTYAAVFTTEKGTGMLDLWGEELGWPQCFQWNVFQHPDYLGRAQVDMDGVLCVNPTEYQDDNGPRYAEFLDQAAPLFVPTPKIGAIVTSRSEAVRPQTEAWLAKHGITYDELVMLPEDKATPARRPAEGLNLKVESYRNSDALLFIESEWTGSVEIANRTGRPVLCTDAQRMALPGSTAAAVAKLRRSPRQIARRLKRRLLDRPSPSPSASGSVATPSAS